MTLQGFIANSAALVFKTAFAVAALAFVIVSAGFLGGVVARIMMFGIEASRRVFEYP